MLEWLRNLLPHHSQGSSVVYFLRGSLTSPFILNNSAGDYTGIFILSLYECTLQKSKVPFKKIEINHGLQIEKP